MTIVGIGASAGGVEALQTLFGRMSAGTGIAFVVVTHLARGRESALVEILARSTSLPVSEAQDGIELRSDHVYVIAPDGFMTIAEHRLQVQPATAQHLVRHPIDVFFASLAQHSGEHAVAIVLSGSGTDGTLGVKAIKERGGLTIAQGPDHVPPRYPGMPSSAIAAGMVDLILPLERMPDALVRFQRRTGTLEDLTSQNAAEQAAYALTGTAHQAICTILRERLGHDFAGYKETTFLRRVGRRMQVLQASDVDAYVERLRREPGEATLLFRDLLIGVTNFFRDADAFAALAELVLPRLFAGKAAGEAVRVWVPACATGEEVYSLAMLLREHADTIARPPEIKLFASDINEPALEVARTAHFPGALLEAVGPERLSRFFSEDAGTYAVTRAIRDMCVFAVHSLVRDPPFSRIDLISCRNLLIYLNAEKQNDVIPIFHYALRPGGFLFLGEAESVSQHPALFSVLDKKHRLFQRREHTVPVAQLSRLMSDRRSTLPRGAPSADLLTSGTLRRSVEDLVLERFAPAYVVVNGDGDVVQYSAGTGIYLEAPSGQPSRHLLSLARRRLRLDLRAAMHEARASGQPVTRGRVPLKVGRDIQLVEITAQPLPHHSAAALLVVLFKDLGPPLSSERMAADATPSEGDATADRLEAELRDTRERLQSLLEEHETGIEELKSSNEELVSLNEELQSTNEELETNKEELQSINEELNTVNAELSRKIEQLDQAHDDLQNLFDSTQVALVFLDRDLLIRRFTTPAASLFSLISSDRGRPLSDINHRLDHDDLEREIRVALMAGTAAERRVTRRDGGGHYLLRILPYHDTSGVTNGVIVTLVGIDTLVAAERNREAAIDQLNARLRQQAAIAAFSAQALVADDLEALLHQASVLVAEGLEIERAKVLELLPAGDRLLIRAGVGWEPGVVGRATIGAGHRSPAGHALDTGEPVVSEDLCCEHRFEVPAVLLEHGIRSAINVIVRGEVQPFGVLEVDSAKPRSFAEDDVHFMQSCANLVAAAIERVTTQARLERALEEKQVLLHELQHRVKNSLQEMGALVGLERRKTDDPAVRRPLEVLGGRIEALSVVYRKLYLADHHTEVDLGDYLTELADELFAFYGVDPQAISRKLQLAEVCVDLDHALPLGLIACEFIVNSFKHAFPHGSGQIGLALEPLAGQRARLSLSDDGVGLPAAGNRTPGSGLQLIKRLVEQINGELQVVGHGSVAMTITFPVRGQLAGGSR